MHAILTGNGQHGIDRIGKHIRSSIDEDEDIGTIGTSSNTSKHCISMMAQQETVRKFLKVDLSTATSNGRCTQLSLT